MRGAVASGHCHVVLVWSHRDQTKTKEKKTKLVLDGAWSFKRSRRRRATTCESPSVARAWMPPAARRSAAR